MTMEEYLREVLRTASAGRGVDMELAVSSLGLVGEAGEFADMIKKHLGHGHDLDKHKAIKELGDVLWYIVRLAAMLGYTLEEVAQINVNKLRERYPNGFTTADSIARVDELPAGSPWERAKADQILADMKTLVESTTPKVDEVKRAEQEALNKAFWANEGAYYGG